MSSIERVETVLRGGIPDRVPVDLHDFMLAARRSGTPFAAYFTDGKAMAQGHIASWREFGHDVVLVENGTAALAQACGVGVEYLADSAPVSFTPAIASLDELDRLVVPDPYTSEPLAQNLRATRLVVEAIGRDAFIIGRADQGPFSLASMIVGMEAFLSALAVPGNEEQLARLLAFCEEVVERYAVAQMEQGAHMTSMGESIAGPDVCSPALYRRWAWVADRRLVRRLAERGIRLAYHICGDTTRIVGQMVDTGAAVLELDHKADPPAVKAATAGRTTVLGVIDPSGVIARGAPASVVDAVREELEVLAPGGGLILGPGCALPPETPSENVHALVEAAHRFGRYSPDGSLLPG
ncbi:MAG: uroporphyrinogen decarboxylase family protein [Candidatus Limnocylindrales bacterium]